MRGNAETLLKSLINRILRRHSETRTNGMVPMTKQKRYREYLLSPSYSSNLYIAILFVLVSVKKKKKKLIFVVTLIIVLQYLIE